jgi:hypothetical protein
MRKTKDVLVTVEQKMHYVVHGWVQLDLFPELIVMEQTKSAAESFPDTFLAQSRGECGLGWYLLKL